MVLTLINNGNHEMSFVVCCYMPVYSRCSFSKAVIYACLLTGTRRNLCYTVGERE